VNKFNELLHTIADSNIEVKHKIEIVQYIIEDITSYGIGSDENLDAHLETTIQLIRQQFPILNNEIK
jgi:hypothetical protein